MNADEELPTPDLSKLPVRVDRETGAELLTRFYFKISPRTLERWPVVWRHLNGKAHVETRELFRVAEEMLIGSPFVRGGRAPQPQQHAAA